MVVRVAGLAYQKGFGGHFHNDNARRLCCATSPAWSSPARPGPTTRRRMLRTCVAAAAIDGTVSVFLEPIALYHQRDLYAAGDERLARPLTTASTSPIGRARIYGPRGRRPAP